MKNLIIISFTKEGSKLNAEMLVQLNHRGYSCKGYAMPRFAKEFGLNDISGDLQNWVGQQWGQADFLFIGAIGIAVRVIAPWVTDKYIDSAVVVMDEMGNYVIPVLSAHIGGAGEIAKQIADFTDARPVFTTATDVQKKFAVDVFAKKNRLKITDRELAKKISAAVLDQQMIGFYSCYPVGKGKPSDLVSCISIETLNQYPYGIAVVDRIPEKRQDHVLYLVPQGVVVGIGCRRGTPEPLLEAALFKMLQMHNISSEEVTALASIDLKKDEKGLLELADELEVPVAFYSCEQLKTVERVTSQSQFVEQTTGVDNVCERAAFYHCPDGRLIQGKLVIDGVAVALIENSVKP